MKRFRVGHGVRRAEKSHTNGVILEASVLIGVLIAPQLAICPLSPGPHSKLIVLNLRSHLFHGEVRLIK